MMKHHYILYAFRGNKDLIEYLVKLGADIYKEDYYNN